MKFIKFNLFKIKLKKKLSLKIGISCLLSCLTLLFFQNNVKAKHIFKNEEIKVSKIGNFIVLGKITDDFLLNFLNYNLKKTQNGFKAILLDCANIKEEDKTKIKNCKILKNSLLKNTPLLIANPKATIIKEIIGFGITKKGTLIVLPQKAGEEYDITLIPKNEDFKNKKIFQSKNTKNECKNKKCTHTKDIDITKNLIDTHKQINVEDSNNLSNCHKRWKFKETTPNGEQGEFINMGFQFDLYYVAEPKPHQKYLVVKTIGKGISAGKLLYNKKTHRGYFQNAITINITNFAHNNWKGRPLELENMAPKTPNSYNTNSSSVSYGFDSYFLPASNYYAYIGFSLSYNKGYSTSFNDFTVNVDSVNNSEQWTYWLSGTKGHRLRKDHPEDLIYYKGKYKIMELPDLAAGAVLMPEVESMYYADGNETGTRTFVGTVTQHLLDLKTSPLRKYTSKSRTNYIKIQADIDFGAVCKSKT